MYQEIDAEDDEDLAPRPGFSVLPFFIGAILAAIVFFVVWLMSPGQKIAPGQSVETPATREAYLQALAEPEPAVRRARLLDHQRVYPDTDRRNAIAAQLDIINAAELQDWDRLVQTVYNERLGVSEKSGALTRYEARWNGRLLGGRGEELAELHQILDTTQMADAPDRSLEPSESPISEDVPSDVLAGAPPPKIVTPPEPEPEQPAKEEIEEKEDVVVQPSVRRNSSPNYPRAAKRKKVSAIVIVSMNIDEKGRVDTVEVVNIQAKRYEKDFKRAAERAAKRTRFNPKTINGEAVPAQGVRKRYIFRAE